MLYIIVLIFLLIPVLHTVHGVEVVQLLSVQQQAFTAGMRSLNRMVTEFGVMFVWVEIPSMSLSKANIGYLNIGSATHLPHLLQYHRMQRYHENLVRRYNACAIPEFPEQLPDTFLREASGTVASIPGLGSI